MNAWRYRLFIGLLLVVALLLVADTAQRYRNQAEAQRQLLIRLAEGTAHETEMQLAALLQGVAIFAHEREADLQRLLDKPQDLDFFDSFRAQTLQHFPSAFAVTVADARGAPVIDDFEGHIEQACLEDIALFAAQDADWPGPSIHPNPHGMHFDTMARWDNGVFFVSFFPQPLAALLAKRERDGHRLLLVSRDRPNLIEISAQGSREQLDGRNFLDAGQLRQLATRVPIAGSNWDLVAIANPQVLQQTLHQLVLRGVGILGLFALVTLGMLWLIAIAEKAREAAQQANRFKSRFLSIISHDIRTPMNSLLGHVQLLEQSQLAPGQRDQLAGIRSGGEHMLQLLNDLVDLSRLEANRLQLDRQPFDLNRVIDTAERMYAGQAKRKDLKFDTDIAAATPTRLIGDPMRLQQILGNLLGNAIKFTAAGSVRLRVHSVHRERQQAVLRFEVTDTGIGIDASQQARLFDDYVQASLSVGRSYGGSGLGLAICRQLTEMMGGSLGLDSQAGRGSTFWLEIPFALDTLSEPAAIPGEEQEAPLRGTVLVVDDDRLTLTMLSDMLRALGWRCRTAGSAAAAYLELADSAVDAILLDGHLPDGEGPQILRHLRRILTLQGHHHPTPVIAITGDNGPQHRAYYLANGFDDYLPKPVDMHRLQQLLQRHLQTRNGLAHSLVRQEDTLFDPDCMQCTRDLQPDDPGGMLGQLFTLFECESRQRVSQLQQAFAQADWETLRQTAHGLKGAAAIVGAQRVVAIAADIEHLETPDADTAELSAVLILLEKELTRVRDYGRQFFGKPCEDAAQGPAGDETLLSVT